jgi:hypothetical protein
VDRERRKKKKVAEKIVECRLVIYKREKSRIINPLKKAVVCTL